MPASKPTSTALTIVEPSTYPVLADDVTSVVEAIRENVGEGATLDEFSLARIKMPSGGGEFYTIPTPDGSEPVKTIDAIVIFQRTTRAYWPSRDMTGDAPQCSSKDGLVGHGDPGGDCPSCPFAQWGSEPPRKPGGANGKGQACKQMRQLLLLLPDGGFLPYVFNLPPTSLKAWNDYAVRSLSSRGLMYHGVVTSIGISVVSGENPYSTATFAVGGTLSDEMKAAAREYANGIKPIFSAAPVVARRDEADPSAGGVPREPSSTDDDEF